MFRAFKFRFKAAKKTSKRKLMDPHQTYKLCPNHQTLNPKPYLDPSPKEPTFFKDFYKETIKRNPKKGRLFRVKVSP